MAQGNTTGKMEHCTSGDCKILQKCSGNASGRQTPYLYVKPTYNCKSFMPAGASEQRTWLCFSYDRSHVVYTEIKLTWVWSLASSIHNSMKKRELNSCPINKERNTPLQQVTERLLMAAAHLLCPVMSKCDTPQTVFLKKRWGSLLNIYRY